jgi:hypothetical protein
MAPHYQRYEEVELKASSLLDGDRQKLANKIGKSSESFALSLSGYFVLCEKSKLHKNTPTDLLYWEQSRTYMSPMYPAYKMKLAHGEGTRKQYLGRFRFTEHMFCHRMYVRCKNSR